VIVCVAEFRSSKGHDHLLEAADLLRSRGRKFRLWLVGDGDLRQTVERQIARLGLQQVVTLLGVRADIPEILAESDVFCLPSLWEGLPGAVMEAMSAGLPVVATAVGGVCELVRDGDTGLVVPPGEPTALALSLERLLDSFDMRQALGAAGRNVIRREFDLDDKVRELENVYRRLASQHGARA
jgi:glycosyltransferase involved in cell wall biosynthesis